MMQPHRAFALSLFCVVTSFAASSCVFEQCCLRPTTGIYDACISAAAPPEAAAQHAATETTEIGPPTHAPAAVRR